MDNFNAWLWDKDPEMIQEFLSWLEKENPEVFQQLQEAQPMKTLGPLAGAGLLGLASLGYPFMKGKPDTVRMGPPKTAPIATAVADPVPDAPKAKWKDPAPSPSTSLADVEPDAPIRARTPSWAMADPDPAPAPPDEPVKSTAPAEEKPDVRKLSFGDAEEKPVWKDGDYLYAKGTSVAHKGVEHGEKMAQNMARTNARGNIVKYLGGGFGRGERYRGHIGDEEVVDAEADGSTVTVTVRVPNPL